MSSFLADHNRPVWDLRNLISMLIKRGGWGPNKEQSQSARGTQLYLQTALYVEAGSGIEQMDDKSVSNEGKHTARCRCFRGSATNLFISVFTVETLESGQKTPPTKTKAQPAYRRDDASEM